MRPPLVPLLLICASTLFACDLDSEADPADDPIVVRDSRDQAAVDRWIAAPFKACSLLEILPHRYDRSYVNLAPKAKGWDRDVILDGADANGMRAFNPDGTEFAAFGGFEPVDEAVTQDQRLGSMNDEVMYAVTMRESVCELSVDGQVVYAKPLHRQMTVKMAYWPGMFWHRNDWFQPLGDDEPALADGYQWFMPYFLRWRLDSFKHNRTARRLATWLRVDSLRGAIAYASFDAPQLFTVVGIDFPDIILGDGQHTIVTDTEAAAFEQLQQPTFTWHYSGDFDTPTRDISRIEIAVDQLRYLGADRRDTAEAARRAGDCVSDVIDRQLDAAVAQTGRGSMMLGNHLFDGCARLTTDLHAAMSAHPRVLALAAYAFSAEARRIYGAPYFPDGDLVYNLPGQRLINALAAAIVSDSPIVRSADPAPLIDEALRSWNTLLDSGLFERRPDMREAVAAACLRRSAEHFNLLAYRRDGLPAITAEQAIAIAKAFDATTDPVEAADVRRFARQLCRDADPTNLSWL